MKKRTKVEMTWMRTDVTEWLIRFNNNPHVAWDEYCKHLIMSQGLRDYYIRGKQDFVKVSQELAIELQREQEENERKQQAKQDKKKMENALKNMTIKQAMSIWQQYKEAGSHTDKLNLTELVMMIQHQDYSILNQSMINTIERLNINLHAV